MPSKLDKPGFQFWGTAQEMMVHQYNGVSCSYLILKTVEVWKGCLNGMSNMSTLLEQWAHYSVTSKRVFVKGLSKQEISSLEMEEL